MTVIIVVTLVVAASVITAILLTRSEMTANEGDSLALTELITVSDIGQGWNSSTPRTYDIPTSIWGPCDRATVDLYGLDDDGKGLLVSSGVALYGSDGAAEESYARLFTMYEESNTR